ncbi:MAG: hypothetical protein HY681_03635 [Chloroflexi bacterium]|nr:hypothetical protein [Chloroflexota bacterium]
MQRAIFISLAIVSGMFGSLLTLTVLWWYAMGNGWMNWLVWDARNEQWVEGVLLHAFIVVYIAFCTWAWKLADREAKARPSDPTTARHGASPARQARKDMNPLHHRQEDLFGSRRQGS